jgi:UV DNA damage endonuclease
MKYGYACINTELSKQKISTNRTLRLKTLEEKGLEYYESLIFDNLSDLYTILQWNEAHGIKFFRISADLFTHRNRISLRALPSFDRISSELAKIGDYIKAHGHRVSIHADHFTILASQRESVVDNGIIDLNFFGEIMDLMGLDRSPYYKINVHVGTAKPSKEEAGLKFAKNIQRLSPSALSRLTVENDDSPNGFTVEDLYNYVYKLYPVPIVFDYLHGRLNPGRLSEEESLRLALSTWADGVTAATHYSSSKKVYEDALARNTAHADYIHEKVQTYSLDFDIMFEAKAKESSVLRYLSSPLNS